MKKYQTPIVDTVVLQAADVIRTSGLGDAPRSRAFSNGEGEPSYLDATFEQ